MGDIWDKLRLGGSVGKSKKIVGKVILSQRYFRSNKGLVHGWFHGAFLAVIFFILVPLG